MLPTSTRVRTSVIDRMPPSADAVILFDFEDAPPPDAALACCTELQRQAAARLRESEASRGKARQTAADLLRIGQRRYQRVILAGAGKSDALDAQAIREAAAAAARFCRQHHIQRPVIVVCAVAKLTTSQVASAATEGFLLASFNFSEYRGAATAAQEDHAKAGDLSLQILCAADRAAATSSAAVRRAEIVALAQNFARTISTRPGNVIDPPRLAAVAQQAARQCGLRCRIIDHNQLKRLGAGGILAVGGGSKTSPPRLVVLEHRPSPSTSNRATAASAAPVLLVGKSLTFDTGGISIKPAEKMGRMIFDKCGGLAVLGAMVAIARLKLPVRVIGILAAAENHVSDAAYRPGDLLRLYNGVTVEVTNTDAEGRLVLADAIAWGARQFRPAAIVDLATLTGGVVVALGRLYAGLMGNDDKLAAELITAGHDEGEKLWRLPLPEQPQEMLRSDYADIINVGNREASPLQGAAFLSFFAPPGTPWAHLDIAGVADTEKKLPLYAEGATGWGVRTLVRWLETRAGAAGRKSA